MESQLPVRDSEPAFDLRWDSSYDHTEQSVDGNLDGRSHVSLRYVGTSTDDPTVKDLIGDLSVDSDLPDPRATWHRNYTPLAPWIRAHVLKLAMRWNGEKQLADHFAEYPELAGEYGFVDGEPTAGAETVRPNPPAQSRLWEMWHEEFDEACLTSQRAQLFSGKDSRESDFNDRSRWTVHHLSHAIGWRVEFERR